MASIDAGRCADRTTDRRVHTRCAGVATRRTDSAARRRAKRAIMAVAHALLVNAYHMLKRKEDYRDVGADHSDRIDVNRTRRSLVQTAA